MQQIAKLSREGRTLSEGKAEHLSRQLAFIKEHLGEESIRKWYVDYAKQYSPSKLNAMQRPVFHERSDELSAFVPPSNAALLNSAQLIDKIVQGQKMSAWCGTNCGAYCSCNSGSLHF